MTKTDVKQQMFDRILDYMENMSEEYLIDDLSFKVTFTPDAVDIEVCDD